VVTVDRSEDSAVLISFARQYRAREGGTMTAGRVVATTTSALLWAAAFIVPQARCMQNRSVTLDQILQRLEQNLQEYDSKIPSFFCDEHLVSEMFPGRR